MTDIFQSQCGEPPVNDGESEGRTYVLGDHTDIAGGKALVFSRAHPGDILFANYRSADVASLAIPDGWVFFTVHETQPEETRTETPLRDQLQSFWGEARKTLEESGIDPDGHVSESLSRNVSVLFEQGDRGKIRYLFDESRRVRDGISEIKKDSPVRFGELMNQSHAEQKEHLNWTGGWQEELIDQAGETGFVFGARRSGDIGSDCVVFLSSENHEQDLRNFLDQWIEERTNHPPETIRYRVHE